MASRTWLITGVSSGFGRRMAEQLLQRGDRVIGTFRKPGTVDDLLSEHPDTFTAEVLDVTDTGAVREVVDRSFNQLGRIADEVQAVADQTGATPAQVALAWLLAKGDDVVPIPGTKRVHRVEENTAAATLELTAEQIAVLDSLTPAEGGHHTEAQMQMIER